VPRAADLIEGLVLRKGSKAERPRTVADLVKENASLRRELERLEVFRTLAYRDPLTGVWNRR
jgi:hypothetical protein